MKKVQKNAKIYAKISVGTDVDVRASRVRIEN